MIEVSRLKKYFGNIRAVDDISFSVKDGERFILLGTSGSGKTTTLKMLNRLIEPDEGTVTIDGKRHDDQPAELLRRQMGYVLQNTGLFPHYTIEENISIVPDLLGWDKDKTKKRIAELLIKFHLPPETYMALYPAQLSGGQQQRVGFARALVANPPILLMDEPLGALDPVTRQQIKGEFKKLNELKGKTIILVTHDISEAIELGNRICVMDGGKIQQTGSAQELLLHPKNEFVKHFFSHNHFLLQLNAFHLADITSYLQEESSPGKISELNPASTLMEVVGELSSFATAKDGIVFHDEKADKFFRIDMVSLFAAVQQKLNPGQ